MMILADWQCKVPDCREVIPNSLPAIKAHMAKHPDMREEVLLTEYFTVLTTKGGRQVAEAVL